MAGRRVGSGRRDEGLVNLDCLADVFREEALRRGPVVLALRDEPHPAVGRLMETLGVRVEVRPDGLPRGGRERRVRTLTICSAPLCRSEAKIGNYCRAHAPLPAIRAHDAARNGAGELHRTEPLPDGLGVRERIDAGEPQTTGGRDGGARPNRVRWTRETMLAALRELADTLGRPPTIAELTPACPSRSTLDLEFGCYADAIVALGFPRPKRGGRKRTGVAKDSPSGRAGSAPAARGHARPAAGRVLDEQGPGVRARVPGVDGPQAEASRVASGENPEAHQDPAGLSPADVPATEAVGQAPEPTVDKAAPGLLDEPAFPLPRTYLGEPRAVDDPERHLALHREMLKAMPMPPPTPTLEERALLVALARIEGIASSLIGPNFTRIAAIAREARYCRLLDDDGVAYCFAPTRAESVTSRSPTRTSATGAGSRAARCASRSSAS